MSDDRRREKEFDTKSSRVSAAQLNGKKPHQGGPPNRGRRDISTGPEAPKSGDPWCQAGGGCCGETFSSSLVVKCEGETIATRRPFVSTGSKSRPEKWLEPSGRESPARSGQSKHPKRIHTRKKGGKRLASEPGPGNHSGGDCQVSKGWGGGSLEVPAAGGKKKSRGGRSLKKNRKEEEMNRATKCYR